MRDRVTISPEAADVVRQLASAHGPLLFHQSGGCCDGTSPMCLLRNEFRPGGQDLWLGEIEGCPFYIAADTFRYFQRCQIKVDITKGRGASFSLEIPLGVRFVTISTVLDETEVKELTPPRTIQQAE